MQTNYFKGDLKMQKNLDQLQMFPTKASKKEKLIYLQEDFLAKVFQSRGFEKVSLTPEALCFLKIERILKDYIKNGKPIPCILLENVKGLLSHDNRRTFVTIYKILTDINYTLECQVVNTKFFGLPQNGKESLSLADIMETQVEEKYFLSDQITKKINKEK